MVYLVGISLIFALRLWIWKFFPGLESGIKDDLSNMIIASLVFGLAIFFFIHKAVRREGFIKSGLEGPLVLFIAAAAISLAWTADMALSVKALIMLLAYVFAFYILLEALSAEYRRRIFLWVFFAGAVVVAVLGINDIFVLNRVSAEELEAARLTNKSLYYILMNKRACSLFGWPNVLAGFLMLSMPLAAALFISARVGWLKSIAATGAVLMVSAFYLTYSFLGWSGFLITTVMILGWLVYRRMVVIPANVSRYLAVGFVLAAVLFAGVVFKKNFGNSMTPRKEYARVARAVIWEHPWRGTGFGAYRFASMKFVKDQNGETAYPHNAYVQVWAETGLPGLAAILWLVAAVFFFAQRTLRRMGESKDKIFFIAVLIGLAAFMVDNINSFTMLKPNASFFFWVWLALFLSYGLQQGDIIPSAVKYRRVVMLVFACVAAAGLFMSTRSVLALTALRTGREAAQAGVYTLAQNFFERAQAFDPLSPDVLTAQGDLALRVFRATSKAVWLDQAQRSFLRAAELSPNYYYNYFVLASIYNARGDRARSEAAFLRAKAVSPYETERDLQTFSRQK